MTIMRALSLHLLLVALAACSTPVPRGYADPGVAVEGAPRAPNAPYYTGADPSFQRGPRPGSP